MTVQTAEFDAAGRRIKKVVTNSGDSDGAVVYLYDGQKIIETRDGSGNMVRQMIHGTQYIDELVMVRVNNKGDLYVHQDANWNVIGLTDLGGRVVERYTYTPYGELTVDQETSFGDYDGDADVDSTDQAAYGGGGDCAVPMFSGVTGACRILDLDFDGTILSDDLSIFTNTLDWGFARHPGRMATSVSQPFAHQGLLHEPEIAGYQNRARQYDPVKRRFLQRDPLGISTMSLGDDALYLYAYTYSNSVGHRDPTGLAVSPCWCGSQPWPVKCTGSCGVFFAPPLAPPGPPPPPPGGPCDYAPGGSQQVCIPLIGCWEKRCVCQCAGNSSGMNCVRGCIQCASKSGAPVSVGTETTCKNSCSLTLAEQERLNCCLQNTYAMGGCNSGGGVFGGAPPPPDPNPTNTTCTNMPIP